MQNNGDKAFQNPARLMKRRSLSRNRFQIKNGFSLAEIAISTAIIGTLSSIAYPSYTNANNSARLAEAKAKVLVIPSIIGQHIDETGEAPTTWDELSSVAVVMTNDGPATGNLATAITLPNSVYDLSIDGPTNSVYTMTAKRVIDRSKEVEDDAEKYTYAIKSCFNISNGASDLRTGNLTDIESELNCG
jgi:prepilin-type N-terminal cleavage/methylation domain-containing protein